ncbi:MAG TPA: peptide ABC transporter substrate-binding protein [Syntrophomonas sp.]|nr:peptide ABC transporter substrate-binding protein [Syntrophomonas sp.]HCF70223.1 peptide ABC transporter substrate-binding protein [Syntrophomonas sp.]
MAALLEIEDLKKHYRVADNKVLKAVDGISFNVYEGETLGIVGESGCGKSTTGRLIMRLEEPTAGRVIFDGTDLTALKGDKLRSLRKDIQIIFQDPYASLNPRMTIKDIIAEPLKIHKLAGGAELNRRVEQLLNYVGLSSYQGSRYPHEFSGGQRQRVGIARALATRPRLVVCDEPVSALDVSIQSQVINLLKDLQQEFKLTYIFIAHGLNVVKHMSDRVGVMYLGQMVELSPSEELYSNPRHPYTRALLSAIPQPVPGRRKDRIILTGDVPSPVNPPPGCHFSTRCTLCQDICTRETPDLREVSPGHFCACHLQ